MNGEIRDSLPLTETTFFILLSLSEEPRHGYGIMKDVESLSERRVQFSTGTLYGALRRLLQEGWIRRLPADQFGQQEDGRIRKFYELTRTGREALEAETRRLRELIRLARVRGSGGQA